MRLAYSVFFADSELVFVVVKRITDVRTQLIVRVVIVQQDKRDGMNWDGVTVQIKLRWKDLKLYGLIKYVQWKAMLLILFKDLLLYFFLKYLLSCNYVISEPEYGFKRASAYKFTLR